MSLTQVKEFAPARAGYVAVKLLKNGNVRPLIAEHLRYELDTTLQKTHRPGHMISSSKDKKTYECGFHVWHSKSSAIKYAQSLNAQLDNVNPVDILLSYVTNKTVRIAPHPEEVGAEWVVVKVDCLKPVATGVKSINTHGDPKWIRRKVTVCKERIFREVVWPKKHARRLEPKKVEEKTREPVFASIPMVI